MIRMTLKKKTVQMIVNNKFIFLRKTKAPAVGMLKLYIIIKVVIIINDIII